MNFESFHAICYVSEQKSSVHIRNAFMLASTDDIALSLTCFCSFSLPCSLLPVLPCLSSLFILSLWFVPLYMSTFSLVFSRIGHQVQVPVTSSFSSPQYTSFSRYLKNIPLFVNSPGRPFLSLSPSLYLSPLLLSSHSCAPMKYTYWSSKYPVPFPATLWVRLTPYVSNLPSRYRPRVFEHSLSVHVIHVNRRIGP